MKKFAVSVVAAIMALVGVVMVSPSAQAVGDSGWRCDEHAGNDWKVCVQVHTYTSGNGYLVNSASVAAYHNGSSYYYNGFKNTYNGYVSIVGSGGNNLGQWNLPNVAPGDWSFVVTSAQAGGGACYTMAGKVNLASIPDENWVIRGNILGGPC